MRNEGGHGSESGNSWASRGGRKPIGTDRRTRDRRSLLLGTGEPALGGAGDAAGPRALPPSQGLSRHPQLHPLSRIIRQPAVGAGALPRGDARPAGTCPFWKLHQLFQSASPGHWAAGDAARRNGGRAGRRPAALHGLDPFDATAPLVVGRAAGAAGGRRGEPLLPRRAGVGRTDRPLVE
jgi:hypothetical protein